MRKAQKRQAEDFLELLGQVHQEIKLAIAEKNIAVAQELLGQCQQGAIELGGLIEKIEGEGFVTVSYLEKYCEIVYGMYEEISAESVVNAEKVYKHLRKALLAVENSVRNDIPVRKEVVFFPYKASMWDSLESVYLAAKEDPECDAYCVPIPYYDRNPDGSFGQIHYEGREYPKNIEVIDWQTYNFEERRPDVIYIHNPYDEYNYVTSVHPRFYSSNLKKYTDELVYIPYFVLPEIDPQDEKMVEKIKHFCLQPGVLNADKVILQSAAMSQIYMNEYIKAAQANGVSVDREQLQKKYLGLGSPKFDKVKNTKKEDIEIPKEWQKLIQKADGSWKKVVFYNTSIAALLEHGAQMLEKMRWVFEVFRDNQNEVALLWRPHPLIKATVESMRPQLWEEYEQLVNDYRSAGWGIYDDTAELNRAIALCDAYYGDPSSVVQLCQEAGMPVMIQKILTNTEYERTPFCYDFIVDSHTIYFPQTEYGRICQCDLDSNTRKVRDYFWEEVETRAAYIGIYRYKQYLFFSPKNAKRAGIAVYNLETAEWKNIEVEEEKKERLNFRANTVFEYNNFLYIFSKKLMVFKIDLTDWSIQEIYHQNNSVKDYGRGELVKHENIIYVPVTEKGMIYCFDLKQGRFIKEILVEHIDGIETLCFDGEYFWITGKNGEIYIYDDNFHLYEKLERMPTGFVSNIVGNGREAFSCSVYYQGQIWLFPSHANMILKIDKRSKFIKEIKIEEEQESDASIHQKGRYFLMKYGVVRTVGKYAYTISSMTKNFYEINMKTEKVRKLCFKAGDIRKEILLKKVDCNKKQLYFFQMLLNMD